MKKMSITFMIALIMFAFVSKKSLGDTTWVCIDAGHGGPGANKFYNGGDGYGGAGPDSGLAEQWVNWQVATRLRDLINSEWMCKVIMTRESEADPSIPTNHVRNLWYRANKANYGVHGIAGAHHFISIHHNGLPLGTKGTEVFWASNAWTDSNYSRSYYNADIDSVLAMKIHFRLLNLWGYPDRCSSPHPPVPGYQCNYCCNKCCYYPGGILTCCYQDSIPFVLRNTIMLSALSEASNLNDPTEELLFIDPSTGHADSEAVAIFQGWRSYVDGMGIAVVKNGFVDGNGMWFLLADWDSQSDSCVNEDTVNSPYYSCWSLGEQYCLKAITPWLIDGYLRTFHHWSHVDADGYPIGPDWYDPAYKIVVPVESDFHRYTAYFTGGPYTATVSCPNGGEVWNIGQQVNISWNVSMGADSTTRVDILLDRNGGNGGYPETLATGIWAKIYSSYTWTVTGSSSTQCRIKILAYDLADNQTYDISDNNFTITSCTSPPNAPSNLYAWNHLGCDARISLGWQDNSSDEDGFNIYRDGNLTGTVGANVQGFTQTGLNPGQNYSYHVKAYIEDCESEPSNTVSQTPGPLTPAAPTNLQVVNVGECQFLATWEDNSDNEDGFVLYNGQYWHASLDPNTESFQGYWYPETEWTQQSDFLVEAFDRSSRYACKSYSNHVAIDPPGGVIQAPSNCQLHGSECDLNATWQNNDSYDFCQVRHLRTGCDIPPWPCMEQWYQLDFLASCGGTSLPRPHGCDCVCVSVRGGKWVNCGSLGNRKWSAYSNQDCLEGVICNEPSYGCPYLFIYDGEKFMGENTVLASVEMAQDRESDVDDYYLLKQSVLPIDSMYKLQIGEFEEEHSFFDQVELLAVDHDFGSRVAVTGDGKIFVYNPANSQEPISCYDENGVNQDSLLQLDPEDRAFLNGAGSLVLDFGPVPQDSTTQILLLPCCGGGDGYSKTIAKVAAGEYIPQIGLLVEAEKEGVWQVVDSIPPRLALEEVFIDLSNYGSPNEELKIKLSWDERGYSFSKFRCFEAKQFDQPKSLTLINASHSSLGNVSQKLAFDDNDYVELLPGEDIDLDFSYLTPEPGKTRDFVFECNGYYITDNLAKAATPPSSEELQQNYPNPFNPQTQIEFSLAEASKVSLVIYNLLGQKVVTLVDEMLPEGKHKIHWNGMDESGDRMASGIYFYRLQAGEYNEVQKMVMLK